MVYRRLIYVESKPLPLKYVDISVLDFKSAAKTEINFTGPFKIISNFVEGIHKFSI